MKDEIVILKEFEDYPMYKNCHSANENLDRFEIQVQEELLADEDTVIAIGDSPEDEVHRILWKLIAKT